jgi:hypothetical protein
MLNTMYFTVMIKWKDNIGGGAVVRMGEVKNAWKLCLKSPKKRGHSEDSDVDERTILKLIFWK